MFVRNCLAIEQNSAGIIYLFLIYNIYVRFMYL